MNMEAGFGGMDVGDLDGGARARRRRLAMLLAGLLALALAAGLFLATRPAKKAAAPDALPQVTVVVPGRHQVTAEISAVGSIAARRDMQVGIAGEGGVVRAVLVEAGDWVRPGQTLAVIDRSVQTQQAATIAANIRQAQADAELAKANLDRARALVKNGFVSKADLDSKQASLDAAVARVGAAQAQLRQQQALIGRLDVRAPAGGLVLTRAVEAGQVVGPGVGALFRVAENGAMELQARLAEADIARTRVGAPAAVTPVGTTQHIAGRIWQIAPVIDPASRQGTVRIALDRNPALRPGGFAAATIGGATGNLPLLPESAVMSDDAGNYVYVVEADGRVARRDVKVGEVDDRGITIRTGLAGTEHVVASAGAFLNPGEKVQARIAPAAR